MNYKIVDLEKNEIIGILNDEELFGSIYVLVFEDLYKGFKKTKENFHHVLNMGWALTEIENGMFTKEQLLDFFNNYFANSFVLEETDMSEEEFEKQDRQDSELLS